MKSLGEMDLQDWEILPEDDDGFLEIHHDGGGSKVYSRSRKPDDDQLLQMNYFICPPIVIPKPQDYDQDDHQVKIKIASPPPLPLPLPPPLSGGASVEEVSQVFFKKMTETEFADMKVESPKSSSKGIMKVESPKLNQIDVFESTPTDESDVETHDDQFNLNIWKWSLTGIGAICSFGIAAAAASVCIIILSTNNRKNKHQSKKNHKFQFQIDTNDKRIRQVVEQASEVISAVRGFPVNKAHITFGGYYDAAATS